MYREMFARENLHGHAGAGCVRSFTRTAYSLHRTYMNMYMKYFTTTGTWQMGMNVERKIVYRTTSRGHSLVYGFTET